MRVGVGFDVHAFGDDEGRELVLAGVRISGAPGLAGHSDADVVVHAICDALLGAAAAGDLGSVFGSADPALAGAASIGLLREVVAVVGGRVGNIDCTVVAERPRLAGHREAMRDRLAGALGVDRTRVSVKITSTDRLGSIGRGEGIACWAVCALESEEP